MARRGHALPDHPQGADLCPGRRDRRRRHDFAARADRRLPQLGLPLLLDPRRDLHALRLSRLRPARGGPPVAGMAAARGRGQAFAAADPVRRRRRARGPRARAAVARRLREQPAGAHRQRGACPAAARCLRRAVRRVPRRAQVRHPGGRPRLAGRESAARPPRGRLADARPGDLGDARPGPALHPLQDHGVGRGRPRGQGGRALRLERSGRALARAARGSTPTSAATASMPSATPSSSTMAARAWMPRC